MYVVGPLLYMTPPHSSASLTCLDLWHLCLLSCPSLCLLILDLFVYHSDQWLTGSWPINPPTKPVLFSCVSIWANLSWHNPDRDRQRCLCFKLGRLNEPFRKSTRRSELLRSYKGAVRHKTLHSKFYEHCNKWLLPSWSDLFFQDSTDAVSELTGLRRKCSSSHFMSGTSFIYSFIHCWAFSLLLKLPLFCF